MKKQDNKIPTWIKTDTRIISARLIKLRQCAEGRIAHIESNIDSIRRKNLYPNVKSAGCAIRGQQKVIDAIDTLLSSLKQK